MSGCDASSCLFVVVIFALAYYCISLIFIYPHPHRNSHYYSLLLFVGLILSAEPGAAENFTSAMKVSCGVAKRNFLSLVCG